VRISLILPSAFFCFERGKKNGLFAQELTEGKRKDLWPRGSCIYSLRFESEEVVSKKMEVNRLSNRSRARGGCGGLVSDLNNQ
jgi:hypothetical protein